MRLAFGISLALLGQGAWAQEGTEGQTRCPL